MIDDSQKEKAVLMDVENFGNSIDLGNILIKQGKTTHHVRVLCRSSDNKSQESMKIPTYVDLATHLNKYCIPNISSKHYRFLISGKEIAEPFENKTRSVLDYQRLK